MRYFLITIFACLILAACKKEYSDVFTQDPNNIGNDTTWKTSVSATAPVNLLIEKLAKPTLKDSFDVDEGATIEFDNSLEITFPSGVCTGNGGALTTGIAKVEIIFLQKKGDMIRYEKPTTSNSYLLKTGGALDIRVTQNGLPLQLAPGKFISIKYKDPQPNVNMKLFYGDTTVNNTGNFDWTPSNQGSGSVTAWEDSAAIIKGYELLSQRFRWINCDYFIDSNTVRTAISALLPLNYTNNNTAVYAVFKDQRTVARLNADVEHRLFAANNIPVGSNIAVISLSKIGEDFYLATKDVTVTANAVIELTSQKKTIEQISDYLDSL